MATSAAVAFGLAAERKAACQQHRCQHANDCSHWTSHHLNPKENATSRQKSHYFFSPGLYSAREMGLAQQFPSSPRRGRNWGSQRPQVPHILTRGSRVKLPTPPPPS